MFTYQSLATNDRLSPRDIDIIKSKTGDLCDRLGLRKFEQLVVAFNQIQTISDWRSFILDHGLLKLYRSPGGYGSWQDLIDILSVRTIPDWVWEKDRKVRQFMPLSGAAKQAFFETQSQIAAALWLQAPVFWMSKKLTTALNDTKHPGNIPELKLPSRSFILALPDGALLNPVGAAVLFMVCTACRMEDGGNGVSVSAWAKDDCRTEYFFVVGFSSWADPKQVELSHLCDLCDPIDTKDRDRENDFMFEISSFVAKALLYFNTPVADTSDRATRLRRVRKHPYTTKPTDLWSPNIVGGQIPSLSTPNNIDRLASRQRAHIVRGHFHTFLTGKGRTEAKVSWIMPYWKGVKENA